MTIDVNHGDLAAQHDRTRLLTFESWVTRNAWFDYALAHPELISFLLIDRSPCQDPFFDPFAEPDHRRPVISGLCRGRAMRNFNEGDRFIYITRMTPRTARNMGVNDVTRPHYFAVAALRVTRVFENHRAASTQFTPRRYVSVPAQTPYPPNLAFANRPEAAAAKVCSLGRRSR